MASPPFDSAVWLCIFEELALSPTRCEDLKAAMLVCKSWKAVAARVLYRSITLNGPNGTCSKLVDSLIHAGLRGESHAQYTRHFHVSQPADSSALFSLLSFFQDLRTFHCAFSTNHLVLQPLQRWSATTILSLKVTLTDDSRSLALAIGILGQMKSLRRLDLRLIANGGTNHSKVLTTLPVMELPWLEELRYRTDHNPTLGFGLNYMGYFARADFPSLTRLALPMTTAPDAPSNKLNSFFIKHGAQLRQLILSCFVGAEGLPQILATLPDVKLETLGFRRPLVPAIINAFLRTLPTTVKDIKLEMPGLASPHDEQVVFWNSVDEICRAVANRKVAINSVSLINPEGFAWTDIVQGAQLSPHVLSLHRGLGPKAIALAVYNVSVYDTTGKGLQLVNRRRSAGVATAV